MPELMKVLAGGIRWSVLPECREPLLGPAGLRLEEWLTTGQARVVKQGPHRIVYRLELPGLNCHVKHNLVPNVRAWLRQLVRPSKARTEFERAVALAARGIPTVTPLALGERAVGLRPVDSFLVTRTLDDTQTLTDFITAALPGLPTAHQPGIRQQLAVALGEFIARLHATGVVHRDLHCGNVLIRLDANGQPALYLIDLHAVRLGPPLGWRASRDNLVMFNCWLAARSNRTDRLRFWHAYREARERHARRNGHTPWPGRDVTAEPVQELERSSWISNRRFWGRRDRRCLKRNRYYQRIHAATVSGHAVTDLDPAALARLLDDPDAPFTRPDAILLKDSRSSTVAEWQMLVNGQVRPVIYKRFRITARSDPWVNRLRRSPALRSWVWGQGLRERQLPTARPLAVFHRRRHGLWYEGYLLTEKITDAVDLHGFLEELAKFDAATGRSLLRQHTDRLAQLIRRFHQCRLSHRDLKAANVLCPHPGGALSGPPCWFIDLVGVHGHGRLSRHRRAQNLARLNASFLHDAALTRTDRLRFLRVYLQWGLFGRSGWKRWWRDIAELTRAKVERNLRRGRPLA